MKERGMTQTELCRISGIPKSALSQYVTGLFRPKQDRTLTLARALQVDPAWLMGYDVPESEVAEEGQEIFRCDSIPDEFYELSAERREKICELIRFAATTESDENIALKSAELFRADASTSENGAQNVSGANIPVPGASVAEDAEDESCTDVFRAAKTADGSLAPGRDRIANEQLKQLNNAPETDEDL